MSFKIPESSFGKDAVYKRKFSFKELYLSFLYVPRSIAKLRKNKIHLLQENQMAVTAFQKLWCAAGSEALSILAIHSQSTR